MKTTTAAKALLSAAESLLAARADQMVTESDWARLQRAVTACRAAAPAKRPQARKQ